MPIPDEIYLFGRRYEVKDAGIIGTGDAAIALGEAKYAPGIIFLNQDVDLEAQLRTLWHEVWHIFGHDTAAFSETAEDEREAERFAQLVSLFVHVVLCHNPQIAECYIPEEEFDDDVEVEKKDD